MVVVKEFLGRNDMTNAEAIETLRANYPDACFEQLREAVDKAIAALEKQIPQKPKRIDKNKEFDGNWIKICPSCKRALIERITTNEESYVRPYNYSEHCKCGQAIDWEE